jgi:hypothetical protein
MTSLGLLAEFGSPEALVAAARRAREAGYRRMDAFTPHPVEDLAEALDLRESRVPATALVGGIAGAGAAYLLQYYLSAVDYPLNVGGRPIHSAPAFIVITFELTILAASLLAVFGMLAWNGLPRPHHPLFAVPGFDLATRNRFFLAIEAADGLFDPAGTRAFLERLDPLRVSDIEA